MMRLLLLAVTVSMLALGGSPSIVLEWRPARPVQGSLIQIEATPAGDSTTTIEGRFAGEPLHFERVGSSYRALGAIPLEAGATARGTVEINLDGSAGATTSTLAVPVGRRAVGSERLRAAERFGRRPDAALRVRLAHERAQINVVLDATHDRPRFWTQAWIRPLPGRVLSGFGARRTFNRVVQSRHHGVDLFARLGDSIHVANKGVVALVADHYYAGRSVWVDHGAGLLTVYLHLSKPLVATGDTVALGQVIGLVGNTGRVVAPHLHWSALYGGISVDPMDLLGPTMRGLTGNP